MTDIETVKALRRVKVALEHARDWLDDGPPQPSAYHDCVNAIEDCDALLSQMQRTPQAEPIQTDGHSVVGVGLGSYSARVQCSSCKGSGSTGEHGCTDCLGKGLDPAAFCGGIEEALNDAYAEGRKDEREQWERVGFIGLDAAQRLAAANLGTTTTITKEAPFDDDVALWRRKP